MSQPRPTPGPAVLGTVTPETTSGKPVARRGSLTRPSPIPSRIVRSAGALVWRPANPTEPAKIGQHYQADEIEVLLVHRPRYDDWSWPKGKAEINEPLLAAAVREVEEETGLVIRLCAPLTAQRYRLGMGQTKEVYYWIGMPATEESVTTTRPPVTPAPKKEIDEARWIKPSQAREMLTRRGDRRLLDDLVARAESGQLQTATFTFLTHARCIGANRPEAQRVLSRVGTRQTIELIDILSALGTTRLLSSPAKRCAKTLQTYATVSGVTLNVAEELKLPAEYSYVGGTQQTSGSENSEKLLPGTKTGSEPKKPTPSPALIAARIAGKNLGTKVVAPNGKETPEVTTPVFQAVKQKSAREVVAKLLAKPGAPIAISVHPELVEHMLTPLVEVSSLNVARQFPEGNSFNQTGQLTVVHVAYPARNQGKPEVVSVEVHRATERA